MLLLLQIQNIVVVTAVNTIWRLQGQKINGLAIQICKIQ